MNKIGNTNKSLKIHTYKGYDIIKDGSKEMPWNIYKPFQSVSFITKEKITLRRWCGMGTSISQCKSNIDDNALEDN